MGGGACAENEDSFHNGFRIRFARNFFLRAERLFSVRASESALSGSVKSSDGKPLEGVGVSARGASETFTTTVYTDESGRYSFPADERRPIQSLGAGGRI